MLSQILFEVSEAQAIDVGSKGAKTTIEGERNVRTPRLAVTHHVFNLQVGIQIGLLVFDVGFYLDGGLIDELLRVVVVVGLGDVAILGMFALWSGEDAQPAPNGHDVEQQHDVAY